MNVSDRFDGAAVWDELTGGEQAEIGAIALELLAAWWAQEQASDPHDGEDALLRAADAAEMLLINMLRDTLVEAVPRELLEVDGQPRLPSLLGPVCRGCGCSQNDACDVGCGWHEPDLCTACASKREDR